jgi:membrane protein implicated in regulation of membrane protease activity
MFPLGIILLLVGAGVVVAAVAGASDQTVNFELGVFNVVMNSLGVFFTGAVTVLLLALGLWLVLAGSRRAARRRKERKDLSRRAERAEGRDRAETGATSQGPTGDSAPTGDTTPTGEDNVRDRPTP